MTTTVTSIDAVSTTSTPASTSSATSTSSVSTSVSSPNPTSTSTAPAASESKETPKAAKLHTNTLKTRRDIYDKVNARIIAATQFKKAGTPFCAVHVQRTVASGTSSGVVTTFIYSYSGDDAKMAIAGNPTKLRSATRVLRSDQHVPTYTFAPLYAKESKSTTYVPTGATDDTFNHALARYHAKADIKVVNMFENELLFDQLRGSATRSVVTPSLIDHETPCRACNTVGSVAFWEETDHAGTWIEHNCCEICKLHAMYDQTGGGIVCVFCYTAGMRSLDNKGPVEECCLYTAAMKQAPAKSKARFTLEYMISQERPSEACPECGGECAHFGIGNSKNGSVNLAIHCVDCGMFCNVRRDAKKQTKQPKTQTQPQQQRAAKADDQRSKSTSPTPASTPTMTSTVPPASDVAHLEKDVLVASSVAEVCIWSWAALHG